MGAYDEFAPYFDAWQDAFGGAYDALVLPRVTALLDRHAPGATPTPAPRAGAFHAGDRRRPTPEEEHT